MVGHGSRGLLTVFLDARGGPSRRVARPKAFLAFSELRTFGRAVFVPWSPETFAFREFYAMAIPLYVPDAAWLLRCALVHYTRAARLPRWAEALAFAAAHGEAGAAGIQDSRASCVQGACLCLSRIGYRILLSIYILL